MIPVTHPALQTVNFIPVYILYIFMKLKTFSVVNKFIVWIPKMISTEQYVHIIIVLSI